MRAIQQMSGCSAQFSGYVPNMNWQQSVSLLIVAVTACMLFRNKFRRRKFSFARDTHCGCSSSGQARPQHSVVYRARKGERPEIIVKFK